MFKRKSYLIQDIIKVQENNKPIRVIYKKTNKIPEIKIINNISKLKNDIIKNNLDIIPYENVFIICFNQKLIINTYPNIILPLKSVYGDFIMVGIDKKQRKFRGLSQQEIMRYSEDLINMSARNNINPINKDYVRNIEKFYERDFERDSNNGTDNIEKQLIRVLRNIEKILATRLN